jgi:formate dehydrogenase major subunit
VFTKARKVIDIEGNPESPVNEGRLCPKGANTFQLVGNPHRVTKVKYRAPQSDHWEEKPLDRAMERIARRVKECRDRDFIEKNSAGELVRHVKSIAALGGAALDNEENYLYKKLFTPSWGSSRSRIRPGSDTVRPCPVWALRSASAPPRIIPAIYRTAIVY